MIIRHENLPVLGLHCMYVVRSPVCISVYVVACRDHVLAWWVVHFRDWRLVGDE